MQNKPSNPQLDIAYRVALKIAKRIKEEEKKNDWKSKEVTRNA